MKMVVHATGFSEAHVVKLGRTAMQAVIPQSNVATDLCVGSMQRRYRRSPIGRIAAGPLDSGKS